MLLECLPFFRITRVAVQTNVVHVPRGRGVDFCKCDHIRELCTTMNIPFLHDGRLSWPYRRPHTTGITSRYMDY